MCTCTRGFQNRYVAYLPPFYPKNSTCISKVPKRSHVLCTSVYTYAVVQFKGQTVACLSILSSPEISWLGYRKQGSSDVVDISSQVLTQSAGEICTVCREILAVSTNTGQLKVTQECLQELQSFLWIMLIFPFFTQNSPFFHQEHLQVPPNESVKLRGVVEGTRFPPSIKIAMSPQSSPLVRLHCPSPPVLLCALQSGCTTHFLIAERCFAAFAGVCATVALTLLSVLPVKPGVTALRSMSLRNVSLSFSRQQGRGEQGKLSCQNEMTPLSSAGEKGKRAGKQAEQHQRAAGRT